ncbi:MAG: hypothetical protein K2H47_00990, partial [Muribaculaceae bacterium]|nr:hypothetical protein [Muribaculaceae bacterium]
MKKIFLSAIVAAAAALPTFAAVDTLNYSAVVRDSDGQPVANQEVTLMFQFLEDNAVKFEETAKVTTSAAGVVNYAIGSTESLEGVDWTANNIKLAVSVDINGGTDLKLVADTNVASVPTALYALKSADTENLYNDIDALYGKAERTEYQISQVAADFANLGENLDNLANELDTRFTEQAGVIENLTMYAEETKATFENINGQLENLNMVAAVTRDLEEKVEANTDAIAEVKKDAYDAFEDIYQQLGAVEELTSAVKELADWHLENDENILSLPATLNAMNELLEDNTADIEDLQGKILRNETVQNDIFAKIAENEDSIEDLYGKQQRNETVQNDIFAKISANEEAIAEVKKDAYDAFEDIYQQLGQVEVIASTLTDYIEQDQVVSGKVEQMEGTVNFLRDEVEANTADIEDLQGKIQRNETVQNDIFAKISANEEAIAEVKKDAYDAFEDIYQQLGAVET